MLFLGRIWYGIINLPKIYCVKIWIGKNVTLEVSLCPYCITNHHSTDAKLFSIFLGIKTYYCIFIFYYFFFFFLHCASDILDIIIYGWHLVIDQIHRIVQFGGDLWRSPSQNLYSHLGQLDQAAQQHIQPGSEYPQGWRLHHVSGQLLQCLINLSEILLLHLSGISRLLMCACCPVARSLWEESVSFFYFFVIPCIRNLYTLIRSQKSLLFSALNSSVGFSTFLTHLLQCLHYLHSPLLDSLWKVHVSFVQGHTELNRALRWGVTTTD